MPANNLIFRFIGIDDGASAEFDRMAGKADTAGRSLKALGVGAAVAFAVVAVESVKAAAKFQQSTELIHTQAGVSQAGVDAMRKSILGLSGSVGTGPEALSEALFHIASTGQRGAAAINELRIAAEGAKVGGADLTDVTNALNATIVSGIKGAGDFGHAMGALNAIVGAGDMHMQDLADALGNGVLAVVKTFGVNLTQAGAALAVFGDNNIRGAQAATYLRQAVQSLSDPSIETGAAALAKIHLTVDQLKDSLAKGGLTGALDLLHTHFESSGIAADKWGDIMEQAFTKKAGTGITMLLGEFGRYQLKLAEVRQGASSFGDDWAATTKNLSFQFDRLQADVQVLAIKLGDDLLPAAMGTIRVFLGVGDAVKATADFFKDHEAITIGLAAALTGALLPALLKTAVTMAGSAWESFALAMLYAKDAVVALAAGEDEARDSTIAWEASLGPAGIALAALGAVAGVMWEKNAASNRKAKQAVDDYVQSLHTNTNSLASLNQGVTLLTHAQTALNGINQKMAADAPSWAQNALKQTAGYQELTSQIASYNKQAATVQFNEKKIAAAYGLTRAQVERLAQANGIDLTGSLQSVDNGFQSLVSAAQLSKSPLKDATANFSDMAQSTTTASQALTALENSFNDLVGNFVGMKQAQVDFKNDLVSTVAALKKSHDSLTLNTKASRDSASAYYSLVAQIGTVTSATYTSSKSLDAAKSSAKGMLAQLEQLPVKGPQVQHVIQGIKKDIDGMAGAALAAGEHVGEGLGDGLVAGLSATAAKVHTEASVLVAQTVHAMQEAGGVRSPSYKTAYIGKMLALGLIQGWTGEAAKIKDVLSTSTRDALTHLQDKVNTFLSKQQASLKAAQSTLKSEMATQRSDISSLAGTISQGAGVSNIFGTDANGNATTANLGQFLGSQVGPLKAFSRDLAMLHKKGLDNNLLNQIAQLGPVQGDQVAQQILSGQDSVRQLNAAQSAINRYSTAGATTVTDSLLKQTIDKDRAAVHDQTAAVKENTKIMRQLERAVAEGVAHHVTIEVGKGGKLKLTRDETREIAKALQEYASNVGGFTLQISKPPGK